MNPDFKLAALFSQDITADKLAAALPYRAMMTHMGEMMWGMDLLWFIVIILLVLAAAALVKYLFFGD